MKRKLSNEFKAGILILVASALLIGLLLRVSGALDLLTRETYTVRARFENILGVELMTKVTLDGVKVGRVTAQELVEDATRILV